jgi:RNA polymerase sigma factor (sigma-70 family)
MKDCMPEKRDEFLPTRQSLLERLKRWDDQESWRDFFDSYGGLLYRTAIKAGLSDSEAQDVVQDTIIAVAKKIQNFRYDPAKDSFKGWLLYLTRKRIAGEYRRRERNRPAPDLGDAAVELGQIADPAGVSIEAVWEEEWARAIWEEALAKVKEKAGAKQFQMFHLYAIKEVPAADVARALGVPMAQVYLAKHRVSAMLKKELSQLKARLE